ncbi:MAG: GNAT family N-acetyltransferase [Patescibacteria group bacterium]
MNAITYERFNPTVNPELLPQLIRCYQDVFSTTPWSEWKTCKCCKKKWGIEQWRDIPTLRCPTCGKPLTDFWPSDVVERDIRKELSMPNATCWLALDGGNVIGFSWGYALTGIELDAKLGITCGLTEDRIAYQDEIGVAMPYRSKHIASELFKLRLGDFIAAKLFTGVVRTKTNPPSVTNLWFNRLGYKVIVHYNDTDGRVIMVRNLRSLIAEESPNIPMKYPGECCR